MKKLTHQYQGWKGSFVDAYFHHLEEGIWVDISIEKYLILKSKGFIIRKLPIIKPYVPKSFTVRLSDKFIHWVITPADPHAVGWKVGLIGLIFVGIITGLLIYFFGVNIWNKQTL